MAHVNARASIACALVLLLGCTSLERGSGPGGDGGAHDGGVHGGDRDRDVDEQRGDGSIEPGRDACVGASCGPDEGCLPRTKLDVLLVLDRSRSMLDRRHALAGQVHDFLRALVSGDADGDGSSEGPGFASVQVAIVTSDLGAGPNDPGSRPLLGCDVPGDDGMLIRYGDVTQLGCAETYSPPFVDVAAASVSSGALDVAARDLECIIRALPDGGCGMEHPLEAALKALSTERDPWRFTWGEPRGDGSNAGFLRDDAMLAVLVMSDEDDCSQLDLDAARIESTRFAGVNLNLRCALLPETLTPLSRYLHGFTGLKQRPSDVVFGAIAGVPEVLVATHGADVYARALEDARMASTPTGDPAHPDSFLGAACERNGQTATPGRRLVELAAMFGERGYVDSLCAPSLRGSLRGFARAVAAAAAAPDCAIDACPCEEPFVCERGRCTCDAAALCPEGACDAVADGCGGARFCGGCPGTLRCGHEVASECGNPSSCQPGHVCVSGTTSGLVPASAALWYFPSPLPVSGIPELAQRIELAVGPVTQVEGRYEIDIAAAALGALSEGYLAIVLSGRELATASVASGDEWYFHPTKLSFRPGWTVALSFAPTRLLPLTADVPGTPGHEGEGIVSCGGHTCTAWCCGGTGECEPSVCESYWINCDGAEDCASGFVCCADGGHSQCVPDGVCAEVVCHGSEACEAPLACAPTDGSATHYVCR